MSYIANFQENGSGWIFHHIDHADVHLYRYNPLRAGSYIPLPPNIEKKKAIVNPKNTRDNNCFLYSIAAATVGPDKHAERITESYKTFIGTLDRSALKDSPVSSR